MSVKIRLSREGRHGLAFYRIVAADHKFATSKRYLEQVGIYDPSKEIKDGTKVNEEVAIKWLNSGAQCSDSVKAIFKELGLIEKAKKNAPKTVKKAKVVATKTAVSKKPTAKKPAAKKATAKTDKKGE
jgi:small subunit ribosomal protein S16